MQVDHLNWKEALDQYGKFTYVNNINKQNNKHKIREIDSYFFQIFSFYYFCTLCYSYLLRNSGFPVE